ncbi:MAG: hypothetical protein ACLVC6_08055 [Alistipes ihumii]|jgi:lipoprotein|uniref:hypothetical protein n=1 Tax=Alistipes ihumii TaxID=1470347 RepID=UPI0027B8EAD3|nr:hypothetical protein [Alistipes ihumii]
MKKLFLAVLIGIMGLASCSKDDPGNQTQNLRWSQVDLTGAKYLVLSENPVSKSTGAPSDVFKVDENGNMTAVVFYFTYDNNGNSQQARTDVKVVPQKISSYDGGQYMLFHDCYIRDEQGQNIHLPHYGGSYNFLIRRKDGAVFHIPYSEQGKFPATNSKYTAKVDHNGDLFVCKSSVISKVEAKDGQTYLRQITPNGMGAAQFMLTDQTDVLLGGFGIADNTFDQANGTVFYPNGGFESIQFYTLPGYYEDRHEYSSYTLFQDGNQVKLFECSTVIRDPTIVECVSTITIGIRDVNFSTTPPVTLSNEYTYSKTWTENRYVSFWGYSAAISCKNHFILTYGGRYSPEDVELLVCDRSDKSMRIVTPTQFPEPEVSYGEHPLEDRMINNTLFYLNTTTRIIQKYDFETLTYSEVQYDDSSVGQYVQLGISLGYNAYIINGVRNSDGRSVVIEINHSTGAVKTTVAPDERKITELIQLN